MFSFTGFRPAIYNRIQADVAQLVEQPIRNRQVSGSSPLVGSSLLVYRSFRNSQHQSFSSNNAEPSLVVIFNGLNFWEARIPKELKVPVLI